MYLLIVAVPLLSAFVAGIFGKFIGQKGAPILTIFCIFFTFLCSFEAFKEVALTGTPCYFKVQTWMDSGMFNVSWGFLFDTLTVVMLVVVTGISTLVHVYSMEYMRGDPHLPRLCLIYHYLLFL